MMKEEYERIDLIITEFDIEDIITTSGAIPGTTVNPEDEIHVDHGTDIPFGTWF
jgi:hypothetical protein